MRMAEISQKKRWFKSVCFLGRGSVRLSLFVCVDGVFRWGDLKNLCFYKKLFRNGFSFVIIYLKVKHMPTSEKQLPFALRERYR